MAQTLTRQTLKVFGTSGPSVDFTKFGSDAAGSPVTTKNIATIQSLPAWLNGWQDAVIAADAPILEDLNAAMYVHSYMAGYLFQEGVAEWDAGTAYNKQSVAKSVYTGGTTVYFYMSLIDSNTNNALPAGAASNSNWKFLFGLSGSGLIVPGSATNDSSAAGMIGETMESVAAIANVGTSGQWLNMTTLSLTAGRWMVCGNMVLQNNGGTISANNGVAVSLYADNTTTDHVDGDNVSYCMAPFSAAGAFSSAVVPGKPFRFTTTTTIYLKKLCTYSAGTPAAGGRITAIRF